MIGGIGLPELIVIFCVILLLFGAKALPDVARGLAQAINVFKKEANDIKDNFDLDQPSAKMTPDSSPSPQNTSDDFDPNAQKRDWRPKTEA